MFVTVVWIGWEQNGQKKVEQEKDKMGWKGRATLNFNLFPVITSKTIQMTIWIGKGLFVPMFPFHARIPWPISTKFCTDLHNNSGKVINTSMTPPTRLQDPRVLQTPEPKLDKGEKTLCNVKCPYGYPDTVKLISRQRRSLVG